MRLVLDTNRDTTGGTLWLLAKPVVPAVIDRTAADPDDDHVLACALAAGGIALINAGEAFARLASDRRSGE